MNTAVSITKIILNSWPNVARNGILAASVTMKPMITKSIDSRPDFACACFATPFKELPKAASIRNARRNWQFITVIFASFGIMTQTRKFITVINAEYVEMDPGKIIFTAISATHAWPQNIIKLTNALKEVWSVTVPSAESTCSQQFHPSSSCPADTEYTSYVIATIFSLPTSVLFVLNQSRI